MYDEDVPQWVQDNWMTTCPECGSFIVDNGNTGVITARWCANPKCPGHMAHRAKALADYFGISGFGAKTALSYIKPNNYESHFDFLKKWFPDEKPLLSLADIAVLCCIEGFGSTQAEKELSCYPSFENYFTTCFAPNLLLVEHRDELLKAETYFRVKPPKSANKMLVMGTGSFHGYPNRETYFALLNEVFGEYVHIIQTGKRKTGISYLIKEEDAVDHSKSALAKACGIPIITPADFYSLLCQTYPYSSDKG